HPRDTWQLKYPAFIPACGTASCADAGATPIASANSAAAMALLPGFFSFIDPVLLFLELVVPFWRARSGPDGSCCSLSEDLCRFSTCFDNCGKVQSDFVL